MVEPEGKKSEPKETIEEKEGKEDEKIREEDQKKIAEKSLKVIYDSSIEAERRAEQWKQVSTQIASSADATIQIDQADATARERDVREVELSGLRRNAREYRRDQVGTQPRQGRLAARMNAINLTTGLVSGGLSVLSFVTSAMMIAVMLEDRPAKQATPNLDPRMAELFGEQLEAFKGKDDEVVWNAVAEFCDDWDPSWHAQLLMMDQIQVQAEKLDQPWVWRPGDSEKHAHILRDAYGRFRPGAGQARSRILYIEVAKMTYDRAGPGTTLVKLPRQVAADLIELAITDIILVKPGGSRRCLVVEAVKVVHPEQGRKAVVTPPTKSDIVKCGLDSLQIALFAAGPTGIGCAVGVNVLEFIFTKLLSTGDSNQGPSLPNTIQNIMTQDLANDHVQTALATILGYGRWLKEQNTKAVSGQFPNDKKQYDEVLSELNGYMVNACDPGSALMQAISHLMDASYASDPPYSVLALPGFLLGASLHLVFEKARLLLLTDATTFCSPIANTIVNAASDYLNHIDATVAVIDSAFSDRCNHITGPKQGTVHVLLYHQQRPSNYIYVADASAGNFPPQQTLTFHPYMVSDEVPRGWASNVVWYKMGDGDAVMNEGGTWKSSYLSGLKDALAKKYNADVERRQDLAAARANLVSIVQAYRSCLPKQ